MDIKPFTPMTRMQRTALVRKTREWWAEVAESYGVSEDDLYLALIDFFTMSLRVGNVNGNLDFKFALTHDDSATIRKKFAAYLGTETTQAVWDIEAAIREYDAPVDEALAPEATPEDPE